MKRSCITAFIIVSLTVAGLASTFGRQAGPPEQARPWVFWYWMHSAVSEDGITNDLEAMKEAGIGGAYIAPIKGKTDPPLYTPVTEQLTPRWWQMVKYALDEAARLGLKIAMLPNDGFATAGGPWITPELSMQKVVWSETRIRGGKLFYDTLSAPPSYEGYYKDIAVLAYPGPAGTGTSSFTVSPRVSTSKPDGDASFLALEGNRQNFTSTDPCWIQYEFPQPFTCRSVRIRVNNYNYQSHRLGIEVSNDGRNFTPVAKLEPPRAGWLDWDADVTHSIQPVTARYFRFVYNREGSEPGAEDLDAAKWKQTLKIAGIELLSEAKVNQFEGKNGQVWRISKRTTALQAPDSLCVPSEKIIDITSYLSAGGRLRWKAPAGNWTILRVGHTSTGHKNETAGPGKGLEVDKFNPEAVKFQFDKWFGEALRTAGPDLAGRVLHVFHVDSWECGSQNWSPVFREEFRRRRGYDLLRWLPVMAGVPVQSADASERFLYDVRQTIAELVNDHFFKTLHALAREKGCVFTSETTAPVMLTDGMRHFDDVDVPMGEFWLRSPSHDKPNDMLDAISGAHIYGKPLVQAEAFTQIRMAWDEHPGNLKTLQDRNYALGINKLVYHVYTHNPWTDRKPGMTLDGVGLYFQRDQTWWKPGREWVAYAIRSQELLQQGVPVRDVAVFTGEELPRRAILPDRLVSSLPGIFGPEVVASERKRLENRGLPMRTLPAGVNTSANMSLPEHWPDPLRGYAYDSFNPDALLRLAKVKDGKVEFAGGNAYSVLVLPGRHQMQPETRLMSAEVAAKLLSLVTDGATVVLGDRPEATPGLANREENDRKLRETAETLWGGRFEEINDGDDTLLVKRIGKGSVIKGPYRAASFSKLGVPRDMMIRNQNGTAAPGFTWTHRRNAGTDIWFVSNQDSIQKKATLSLRMSGRKPVLYNAVTGNYFAPEQWSETEGRTDLTVEFSPNASWFILSGGEEQKDLPTAGDDGLMTALTLDRPWQVTFDSGLGGPAQPVVFNSLTDWSTHADSTIRYYSGTAAYIGSFNWKAPRNTGNVWLDLGETANLAEVTVNGVNCGVAWTAPYRIDISHALRKGRNDIQIAVTNTWANRLIGDQRLPEDKRITYTTAPFRLSGSPLLRSGLLGPVQLMYSNKK